jgi:hypothetical protein
MAADNAWSLGDLYWISQVEDNALERFIEGWLPRLESVDFNERYDLIAEFTAELSQQQWWQSHTASWREAEETKWSDRASYDDQIALNKFDISTYAGQLGYELSGEELDDLAERTLRHKYTPGEIEREILKVSYFNEGGTSLPGGGSIQEEYNRIKSLADSNLVTVSDDWIWRQAHKVLGDKMTTEQVDQMVYKFVSDSYSFLDPDTVTGWSQTDTTVSDTLAPVLQTVQSAWEDTDIDLSNDWFKENLVVEDDDGTSRWLNLREARQLAYQDERYLKTSNHRKNMDTFATSMLNTFGIR